MPSNRRVLTAWATLRRYTRVSRNSFYTSCPLSVSLTPFPSLPLSLPPTSQEGVGGLFNGALSNTFRGFGAACVLVLYDWLTKVIG